MHYKTITDKRGNVCRYKTWVERFNDPHSTSPVKIQRHQLIKVNGQPVKFYTFSQLAKMSKKQQKSIEIKWK